MTKRDQNRDAPARRAGDGRPGRRGRDRGRRRCARRDVDVDAGDGSGTEPPAVEAPKTPFWQRPTVERYLVPFVLPLVVIVGLVMLILNISRIFLSLHGNVDVLIGTAILLTILVGAAILSASPRLRSSSLALCAGGFILTLDDVRLALARQRGTGRRGRHDPRGGGACGASARIHVGVLLLRSGFGTRANRHRGDLAHERRRGAHVRIRRRRDALRDARGQRGRRSDRGPRVLRRGRRVRLLLHDPRPPRGRHAGRDQRHGRNRHARSRRKRPPRSNPPPVPKAPRVAKAGHPEGNRSSPIPPKKPSPSPSPEPEP